MKVQRQQQVARELADQMRSGCLGVRIGRLQRLVGRTYEQALRPLGLSVPQMEVLGALVLTGTALRPAQLAEWLCIERSTMSRNLALMEQRGLVEAAERSAAGRTLAVAITRNGVATLAEAREAWTLAQAHALATLGPDAATTLDGWIRELGTAEVEAAGDSVSR